MRRSMWPVFALSLLVAITQLLGDELKGSDRILCSAVEVTECIADGGCTTAAPWELNVPQFIEVDLQLRRLSTTKASGENRSTPLLNIEEQDGAYYLQGVEGGRAFSFVITKKTGRASISVATQDRAVSVFGACTPLSK